MKFFMGKQIRDRKINLDQTQHVVNMEMRKLKGRQVITKHKYLYSNHMCRVKHNVIKLTETNSSLIV